MRVMRGTMNSAMAVLFLSLTMTAPAQWEKKPYTEWSEKEAQKMLNDSPWGRTQIFTSPGEFFREPVSGRAGAGGAPPPRPANAIHVNFRIRFLSSKPIRQAIGRMLELSHKGELSEATATRIKSFTSGEFLEYIIITVTCDSRDAGANVREAQSLLSTRGTGHLKNNTFLETKGGKRLFLQEYQQPRDDGVGARFIFPRLVDGKPFITPESEEVRFFSELSGTYRLDRRYKVKDMTWEGKLEY